MKRARLASIPSDEADTSERKMRHAERLRGVPLPPNWTCVANSLLVYTHGNLEHHQAVAAFDFDGTLANTPLGGFDPKAWKPMWSHVPDVLRRLHAQDKRIVVLTNESMDRYKKDDAINKCILKKTGRLEAFAKLVDVPMLIMCATAKDAFRKPSSGAWSYFLEQHCDVPPDLGASFFVGDAAG